jgi:hypothetical protein
MTMRGKSHRATDNHALIVDGLGFGRSASQCTQVDHPTLAVEEGVWDLADGQRLADNRRAAVDVIGHRLGSSQRAEVGHPAVTVQERMEHEIGPLRGARRRNPSECRDADWGKNRVQM